MVIYKRVVLGKSHEMVTDELEGVTKHFQEDMLKLFYRTGDVRGKIFDTLPSNRGP